MRACGWVSPHATNCNSRVALLDTHYQKEAPPKVVHCWPELHSLSAAVVMTVCTTSALRLLIASAIVLIASDTRGSSSDILTAYFSAPEL